MRYSMSWILMGTAAALLGGSARAGDQVSAGGAAESARTVQVTVSGNEEHGHVAATPGEPVRLVFIRTEGPDDELLVLPDQRVAAPLPRGEVITLTVRSARDGIEYSVWSHGEGQAGPEDAAEVTMGNTGGRG